MAGKTMHLFRISRSLPFLFGLSCFVVPLQAKTTIVNDWTGNNQNLPDGYGSNVATGSTRFSVALGEAGVTGTPDIAVAWAPNGNGGWQTYTSWDGRGDVLQVDSPVGGPYPDHTIVFAPPSTAAVKILALDFDEWVGGGTVTADWSVTGPASGTLASGTWTGDAAGRRETVAINAQGALGETLTLAVTQTAGKGNCFAIDNLAFDQIPSSTPAVAPRQASCEVGADILVDFAGGPGNPGDWIGIYDPGVTPDGNPAARLWLYTNGTQTAGGSATSGSATFANPNLPAGTYAVWFLEDNGYSVLAGPVDLVVANPGGANPPEWIATTFRRRHAVAGAAYTGKISAYAKDPDGDPITFAKSAGPAWLTIASDGTLSGTPANPDAGASRFTVEASDGTHTAGATMTIEVFESGAEHAGTLKILSYNLWHGWGQINDGQRKGIESIILSDADIIGTQETVDNASGSNAYQVQAIAAALGWFYSPAASGDMGIASRYPITAALTAGIAKGVKVQLTQSPLREVILYNAHLDYQHYGPYEAQKNGATAQSVLAEELRSQRDEQIDAILSAMASALANADDTPVFLTGDFNAPSHLDWTEAAAPDHGGVWGVAWPASAAVENADMLDSFRTVHPDPVADPGYSWSPLYLGDPRDRIDFVYYKGAPLLPISSEHFHTAIETTLGPWGDSITPAENNTWPSDHGAMLTTFHLDAIDTDDDSLSDAFEIKHFGNLTSQSGSDDADLDGHTNFAEQLLGSSPTDPASVPAFTITLSNDSPVLDFSLSPLALGPGLVCERSTDLQNWTPVWSCRADPNLQSPLIQVSDSGNGNKRITLTDPNAVPANSPRYFYRLRSGS